MSVVHLKVCYAAFSFEQHISIYTCVVFLLLKQTLYFLLIPLSLSLSFLSIVHVRVTVGELKMCLVAVAAAPEAGKQQV